MRFFSLSHCVTTKIKNLGNFDNWSRTAKGRDKHIPEGAARGEIGYGEEGEGEVCPPGEQEGRCTQLYPSILGRTQRWGELSVLWRVRHVTFSICLWFLYFGLKPVPAAPKPITIRGIAVPNSGRLQKRVQIETVRVKMLTLNFESQLDRQGLVT